MGIFLIIFYYGFSSKLKFIYLDIKNKYSKINAEYIGGNLIEIHLRHNPDFTTGCREYIPVWHGQDEIPPEGYEFIEDPDVHWRIGARVR